MDYQYEVSFFTDGDFWLMLRKTWLIIQVLMLLSFLHGIVQGQTTIAASLTKPGSSYVQVGTPFELHFLGTFDADLVAVDFRLATSGDAAAQLTGRSANPPEPNGLTYISFTSQNPFEDNLPHDFATGPAHEVLMDIDFGGTSGGPQDGLAPGSDIVIETLEITPTTLGPLTITLSDLKAATTQDNPDGALFDLISIEQAEVTVTVVCVAYYDLATLTSHWLYSNCDTPNDWCKGADHNQDHNINFLDFAKLASTWLSVICE
jgi:hypothetical protein